MLKPIVMNLHQYAPKIEGFFLSVYYDFVYIFVIVMNKNAPEIQILRKRIESKVGRSINSPSEFSFLADAIKTETGERLSPYTLERLWGYISGAETTRQSTLRILASFLGYVTFEEFCCSLSSADVRQSGVAEVSGVYTADLSVGQIVEVAWLPNRRCRFRFLGGTLFEVVWSENSKLQVGDTFNSLCFMQGLPLYLSNMRHDFDEAVVYVAGRKDGLSFVSVV